MPTWKEAYRLCPCIFRHYSCGAKVREIGIQDAIISDHSGCWVEFDGVELLNGSTEVLSSFIQLPFIMQEMEKLEKFTTALDEHLNRII